MLVKIALGKISDIVKRKTLYTCSTHWVNTSFPPQAITELAKQRWMHGLICGLDQDPFNLEECRPILKPSKPPRTAVLYQPRQVLNTSTGKLVLETAV